MICRSLSAIAFTIVCLVAKKLLRRNQQHMMFSEFKERYDKLPKPIKRIIKPAA